MAGGSFTLLETLQRLAPGTPLRQALERIIQQGTGGLLVLGNSPEVEAIGSGGFRLQPTTFSPARLAELSKMDGAVVLDDDWDRIIAANVHFQPSGEIPTEETGARHRTAERVAKETGKPVVAVSEGRRIATLFYDHEKLELPRPTVLAAKVNQDLQTLDRLRRRMDEAEERLTLLEVTGLTTYRAVVTLLQRAEMVLRVGHLVERDAVILGDEGRLVWVQLSDLRRGVEHSREVTLLEYLRPRRSRLLVEAVEALQALSVTDLDDPLRVGKAIGFPELDEPAPSRGYRILSKAGRIPELVREQVVRHFPDVPSLVAAGAAELEQVEGIGATRAAQLRHYFDRLLAVAATWEPDLG
jgi:diadenylate cyclase